MRVYKHTITTVCPTCEEAFHPLPGLVKKGFGRFCSRKCIRRRQYRIKSPAERFWSKVNKNGPIPGVMPSLGKCWLWTGNLDKDRYGRFTVRRDEQYPAPRYAYFLGHGKFPEGVPDHLCKNPSCVRPSHLEDVTVGENNRRGSGWAGINAQKHFCKNGHEFTPDNTYLRPSPAGIMWRSCRTCLNANQRKLTARKKQQAKAAA